MIAAVLMSALALAPPTVTGPRETLNSSASYTFASKGALAYRCALDSTRLGPCRSQATFRLALGTHVLRVQAVGRKKRLSAVRAVRLTVDPPAPQLQTRVLWRVHANPDTSGTDTGGFISLGGDRLYVPDAVGNRVVVYDVEGHALSSWGSHGTAPGQFGFLPIPQEPAGIGFGGVWADPASGTVYVADTDNYRVQKFSSNGSFVLQWGTVGGGNGQFTRVFEVIVAGANVYTLEDRPLGLGRVQVFDASGRFVRTFGRGKIQDSGGVAVDGSGNVVVADDKANDILFFSPTGKLVRTFGEYGTTPGQLSFPTALAIDGSNLWVCDTHNSRVERFDLATGRPSGYFNVDNPEGIAVDGSGHVYTFDGQENLTKFEVTP